MKSKDRVTLVLASNSTGTCKIPVTLIGKAERPMCFREGINCPIPYFSQVNAWMDTRVCQRWFDEVFAPTIKKFTNKPVILIWDGSSSHSIMNDDPQFSFVKLPPNTTCFFQPLDQGIISVLKRQYRSKLVSKLISMIDNWHQLRESGANMKRGCAGLEQACNPNMLDVATLVDACWSDVSCETIINCFLKAHILPEEQTVQLQSLSIKSTLKFETQLQTQLTTMIERGPTQLPSNSPEAIIALCDIPTICVHKIMDAWFKLEKQECMLLELIEDVVE
jgi:hypothetical protein